MRQEGVPWRAVGQAFGISKARAREIYRKEKRKVDYAAKHPESDWRQGFGVMIWNILIRQGVETPTQLQSLNDADLLSFYGLGRISLKTINEWRTK